MRWRDRAELIAEAILACAVIVSILALFVVMLIYQARTSI